MICFNGSFVERIGFFLRVQKFYKFIFGRLYLKSHFKVRVAFQSLKHCCESRFWIVEVTHLAWQVLYSWFYSLHSTFTPVNSMISRMKREVRFTRCKGVCKLWFALGCTAMKCVCVKTLCTTGIQLYASLLPHTCFSTLRCCLKF